MKIEFPINGEIRDYKAKRFMIEFETDQQTASELEPLVLLMYEYTDAIQKILEDDKPKFINMKVQRRD